MTDTFGLAHRSRILRSYSSQSRPDKSLKISGKVEDEILIRGAGRVIRSDELLSCVRPRHLQRLVASVDSQDRVVTGHTSDDITYNHGEKRTVVRRCCGRSRI